MDITIFGIRKKMKKVSFFSKKSIFFSKKLRDVYLFLTFDSQKNNVLIT